MASLRWARNHRLKCLCLGYHFPHRRSGGACDHSRTRDFHLALRQGGNAVTDYHIEAAGKAPPHTSEECPF